jgi:hypothetical protein
MRRESRRKNAVGVSLFPFLAVLICTMGALIVLLVLMVQQARVLASAVQDDEAAVVQQSATNEAELRQQLADYDWRREVLETQRTELTEQLSRQRLELSHLEDHIRRLQDRWKQLVAQVDELQRLGQQDDQATARAELDKLRQAIGRASQELDDAKKKAASRPRSYAVVPYDGPNGTRRRPIYIECTGEAVILQPEGIVLSPDDFSGPLMPGNPLDAALLATREYLARNGAIGRGSEPYPLLLVRPEGAISFAMSRAAMKSWEDEFGYELIDADIKIQYPPPDPALARELDETVRLARRRQEILAAAQPSRFRGDEGGGFVATDRRGGFVSDRGNGSNSGRGSGFGGGDGGFGGGHGDPSTMGRAGGDARPNAARPGDHPVSGDPNRDSSENGGTGSPTAAEVNRQGGQPSGQTGGQSAGQSGGQPGGTAQLGSSTDRSMESLSRTRGSNWALPNATPTSTGFTRPISVACYPDRLVLIPERGTAEYPLVVTLTGPMRGDIDQFVSTISKRTQSWGIAGPRAYWKPVLTVDVAPGADGRYAELESLLRGSGLDVQRKTP